MSDFLKLRFLWSCFCRIFFECSHIGDVVQQETVQDKERPCAQALMHIMYADSILNENYDMPIFELSDHIILK